MAIKLFEENSMDSREFKKEIGMNVVSIFSY